MTGFAALAVSVVGTGCREIQPPTSSSTDPTPWEVRHVDAIEAAGLIRESRPVLLDVRTLAEFREGHLPRAINIDFRGEDFRLRLSELDRSKTFLVYCRSGNRSTQSLRVLEELGFRSVAHLDGGFMGWTAARQPVER